MKNFQKTFNEVEVWRIGWQKQDDDPGILQILSNRLGAIVASVVADDRDALGQGVGALDLLEQGDGGDRVDGVVEADLGTHTLNARKRHYPRTAPVP